MARSMCQEVKSQSITPLCRAFLENARRAKAKEDWEECEKYYNMVEQYEPTNIEAIFTPAMEKQEWHL